MTKDDVKTAITLVTAVLPHAIELVSDLLRLHDGDVTKAIQDITDRRVEVQAMWAKREAELKAKRYPRGKS